MASLAERDGIIEVRDSEDRAVATLTSVAASDVTLYNTVAGKVLQIGLGTSTAPDRGLNPVFKVTRTVEQAAGALTGDGGEQMSAAVFNAVATANNVGQVVGLLVSAQSSATNGVSQSGGGDSCALYSVGRITGSGTGTGIGAFHAGRRDTNTGKANAMELSTQNYTASAGVVNTTGFSDTTALWIEATGNSDSAVGISFGNPFGFQYDTGILFTAQVNSTKTGGVKTYAIRDEGNSVNGILINGTKTGYALAVGANAGAILIGGTSPVSASSKFEVQGPNATADPLVMIGSSANTQAYTIRLRNAVGTGLLGISAGAGNFVSGSIAGDFILSNPSSGKSLHIGGTASTIQVTQANALGFFSTTPIARPTVTGALSTVTDAAAKAVLTSILAALSSAAGLGLLVNSTT